MIGLFLAFLLTNTTWADSYPNMNELSASEREHYPRCAQVNFLDDSCQPLKRRICESKRNQDLELCIRLRFEDCLPSDFNGSGCQQVLTRACRFFGSGFDWVCDRLSYETCLAQHFEGEDYAKVSCAKVRMDFTLPILRQTIRQASADPEIRPKDWVASYCALSGGDPEHPLNPNCRTNDQPAPQGSIGVHEFFETQDFLMKLSSENRRAAYQRLLMNSGPRDSWESIMAHLIWIKEQEAADAETRSLAAEFLSRYADESSVAQTLLIEASRDSDARVRKWGTTGLAKRRFGTALGLAAILSRISDQSEAVRSEALKGLGSVWISEANVVFAKASRDELGALIDCQKVQIDESWIARLNDPIQARELPFDDPRTICSRGVGADLARLRPQIVQAYLAILSEPLTSPTLSAAALFGLSHMYVATLEERRQLMDLAERALQGPDALIRDTAVHVLATLAFDPVSVKRVATHVARELSLELDRGSVTERAQAYLSLIEGRRIWDPSLMDLVLKRCMNRAGLSLQQKAACFQSISGAENRSVEQAMIPQLLANIEANSYADRETAIGLLSGQLLTYVDEGGDIYDCHSRSLVLKAVRTAILNSLQRQLSRDAFLISGLVKILDQQVAPVLEVCPNLNVQLEELDKSLASFRGTLESLLKKSIPELPIKNWYSSYSRRHPVDVVELDPHTGFRDSQRRYAMRRDLELLVQATLKKRSTADLVVQDFAIEPVKALYLRSLGLSKEEQHKFDFESAFWGVDPQ